MKTILNAVFVATATTSGVTIAQQLGNLENLYGDQEASGVFLGHGLGFGLGYGGGRYGFGMLSPW